MFSELVIRQDLIDEINQLRQQVIELQSEIIRLKQPQDWPIMPNDAPWQRSTEK